MAADGPALAGSAAAYLEGRAAPRSMRGCGSIDLADKAFTTLVVHFIDQDGLADTFSPAVRAAAGLDLGRADDRQIVRVVADFVARHSATSGIRLSSRSSQLPSTATGVKY